MNPICGIYIIKNMINSESYVGQSTNIMLRWRQELSCLMGNRFGNQHLQRAWNKYGKESFEFRILEETSEDMLDIRETAWIIHYKSNQRDCGYNIESGGNALKHLSGETKLKIGNAHRGRKIYLSETALLRLRERAKGNHHALGYRHTPEAKDKIRLAAIATRKRLKEQGWKPPQSQILRLSELHRGTHMSKETCEKISRTLTGCKRSEQSRERMREAWIIRKRENNSQIKVA